MTQTETEWEKYTRDNVAEIARLIASGELPATVEGYTIRVLRPDLERLLAEGKLPPM